MHSKPHKSLFFNDSPYQTFCMHTQDEIFLKEGDNWFERNKEHLGSHHIDNIQTFFESNPFRPQRILDIGCSSGHQLHALSKQFDGLECYGLEPSQKAIDDGKKRFPTIQFTRGLAHDLHSYEDDFFDTVIVSFVFHWIDRSKLLRTVSEIDRVLRDEGHLIIQDFDPTYTYKALYHHLPGENVFTYKQPYWNIFTSSNMYNIVSLKEFEHSPSDTIDNKKLCKFVVLQKRQEYNYPLL